MKFIYRGIKYQSNLRDDLKPEITTASKPEQPLKCRRVDFFTYRGISYSKYYPF